MTTKQMSSRTKVKCSRTGTPSKRTDPTDPELAALGVLPSCAKSTSAMILTQGFGFRGLLGRWFCGFRQNLVNRLVVGQRSGFSPLSDRIAHYPHEGIVTINADGTGRTVLARAPPLSALFPGGVMGKNCLVARCNADLFWHRSQRRSQRQVVPFGRTLRPDAPVLVPHLDSD